MFLYKFQLGGTCMGKMNLLDVDTNGGKWVPLFAGALRHHCAVWSQGRGLDGRGLSSCATIA